MQNPSGGKSALGLDANVAAGLAYIPICFVHIIISIIILVTDKTNKLARFHAVQSLLLTAAAIVGYIVCWIVMIIIAFGAIAINMPSLAFLGYLILLVYGLGVLAAIIISCVKAFTGQIFKLPIIGNMADNWSN